MKVVVLGGTGAVGRCVVEELHRVDPTAVDITVPTRSQVGTASELGFPDDMNVHLEHGDVLDREFLFRVCRGAKEIYLCVGFREYQAQVWAVRWPLLIRNCLDVAEETGAVLVFADNLYAYGPGNVSTDMPRTESFAECTTKPGIRVGLHKVLKEAMEQREGVNVAVVGAADFFGPHCKEMSVLGFYVIEKVRRGERATGLGSVDVIHDYAYVPDIAKALVSVAKNPNAWNRFWIAPHAIQGKTTRAIARDIAEVAGSSASEVKISAIGGWILAILGLFVKNLREMREMMPWWSQDYTVDETAIRNELGLCPTDYQEALRNTIEWQKNHP